MYINITNFNNVILNIWRLFLHSNVVNSNWFVHNLNRCITWINNGFMDDVIHSLLKTRLMNWSTIWSFWRIVPHGIIGALVGGYGDVVFILDFWNITNHYRGTWDKILGTKVQLSVYEKVHHGVIGKFVTSQQLIHLVQYMCGYCITNYGTHQSNKLLWLLTWRNIHMFIICH